MAANEEGQNHAHKLRGGKSEQQQPAMQWKPLLQCTFHALSSSGYVPNLVVSLVIFLAAPAIGVIMKNPKVVIISLAASLTIAFWVFVIFLVRQISSENTPARQASAVSKPSEPATAKPGRRLTEWQRVRLIAALSKYPGHGVRIRVSAGDETLEYAKDFRSVFLTAGWTVEGPIEAPLSEPAIDVQVSVNNHVPPPIYAQAFQNNLTLVGIKCRGGLVFDPNVSQELVVLWIGARTPDSQQPDLYPPLGEPPTQN